MMALNIFKLGDKVKIIDTIADIDDKNASVTLEDKMRELGGQWGTIIETDYDDNTYRLKIDGAHVSHYWWELSWLEPYEETPIIDLKKKPHYEVGDYVRIRNDIQQMIDDEVDVYVGIVSELTEYAGKLARITKVEQDSESKKYAYHLDVDDGAWWWCNELFEYRLGNYEDNKIENHRFKYVIGYRRYLDKLETFEGFIENFYPSGKSAFVDENGKLLVLPYDKIEFIIPKESDND